MNEFIDITGMKIGGDGMNASAHSLILRAADRGKPFCPADPSAEQYLISNGYARYTTRPLMELTRRGHEYARREKRWAKTGRTS